MEDILTNDLSTMDTSFPLVNPGLYDLRVAAISVMDNPARTLKLELQTTEAAQSNKGDTAAAGTKVFTNVNTRPTGKSTLQIIGRQVANLVQAAKLTAADLGGGTGQQQLDNVAQWAPLLSGKVLRARVIIEPAGTGRDGVYRNARNSVVEYVKS